MSWMADIPIDRLGTLEIDGTHGRSDDAMEPGEELIRAAETGQLDDVNRLLESGVDVDAVDWDDATALYRAVEHGHLHIVKALIDSSANVNAVKPGMKDTALHLAANPGLLNGLHIVKALLDSGADVNAKDLLSCTALQAAAQGPPQLLEALLIAGADVDAKDQDYGHNTALQLAAGFGHLHNVHLLLKYGADIHVTDEYGETALDYAAKKGHLGIVKLLVFWSGYNIDVIQAVRNNNISPISTAETADWLSDQLTNAKPLQQCCRLAIRKSLGCRLLDGPQFLSQLLPAQMVSYLLLDDLVPPQQ